MRKSLTLILIFAIFSSASARTAFGWNEDAATQNAKLKSQIDSLPSGTHIKIELRDHRKIEGELIARSDQGFEVDTPELTKVSYSEVNSIIDEPAGQIGTSGTPSQPAKHHHLVRTLLIGLGAMVAFALFFAVNDK